MIVEVKGVEFENKGAHLMLVAIQQQLIKRWPKVQIALTHSSKASYLQRSSMATFRKLNFRKNMLDLDALTYVLPRRIRGWLKQKGLVTEVEVDMIIDASGFSYSDQWPSKLRIYHLKHELERFNRYKKPYIFLPQAFGPFTTEVSRQRIGQSFQYAAMICAREQQSFSHIEELTGPIGSLFQYDDFTNLVDGVVPDSFDDSQQWACIVPNKNMVNARNVNRAWLVRYESLLAEAIIYYRKKGLTPFFLNHEGRDDAALIDRVNNALDQPISVVTETNPLAVKGIIGSSRAVLCSRYHGCISALTQGIPCIGTSWSHKYELLYKQYQAGELLLEPAVTTEKLQRMIDLSLETDSQISKSIALEALALKVKSAAMWEDLQSIVEHYPVFKRERQE